MNNLNLVPLAGDISRNRSPIGGRVMLVKPPYFTPWTPPLGIAILKAFLEKNGFRATCFDFNVDPELWGMHHRYFAVLQALEDVSINDGYSKLWWILNAHLLAYANGATRSQCVSVLETVIPLYGIGCDRDTMNALIPLVERFFTRLESLINEVNWSEYSVIGTSTYTTSLSASLFILKKVKEKYSHVTTVMGGGVFADDLALGSDNLNTLIDNYPYVDHMVLGEGELLLLKLLQGEFAHKRVITISDLSGATLNMKDVPAPDFSDLDNESYYHLTIEGARSCPFQCSFCSETIQWGEYRKKPINLFVEQILELAKTYGNRTFFMGDSLMNPYINPFASNLISREAGLLYDGYLRADRPVTNREFVKKWARSGLFRVRLGIESATSRVLDAMDKMTTPEVISEALKTLAAEGIRTTTYWIVGFPGETEEDFQETCEFIREHHRYIYELEAHPYYYYPYGQVGSRLYKCRSLYPEEVTEIIKFKVWDIIGAEPSRHERYDRLRRFSKLASDLGLPNIYTMAERYQAEERWHSLHPLAAEVYEGTRLKRSNVCLSNDPLRLIPQLRKYVTVIECDRRPVHCYQIGISEEIDEAILSRSILELIRRNDVLQMSLIGEEFVAMQTTAGINRDALLVVYDAGKNLEAENTKLIETVSAEMLPEAGKSVRSVLIKRNGSVCRLLLLVHRAIADSRSVVLLIEDLHRIYTQLSRGMAISLRPVKRTFSEFLKESTAGYESNDENRCDDKSGEASASCSGYQITHLDLDDSVFEQFCAGSLRKSGPAVTDVISAATLRVVRASENWQLELTRDLRINDPDLTYTAGNLTTVESPGSKGLRALLNLEYCIKGPWLGEILWLAEGFVLEDRRPGDRYLLEVIPVLDRNRLRISIVYRDRPEAVALAGEIKCRLVEESKSILAREHHAADRMEAFNF